MFSPDLYDEKPGFYQPHQQPEYFEFPGMLKMVYFTVNGKTSAGLPF